MTDLKPCPFCGGSAQYDESENASHWVECTSCGAMSNEYYSYQDSGKSLAKKDWNRRASGWISVKDRLPDDDEQVLVFTPYSNPTIRHRLMDGDSLRKLGTDATHWQPLPDPPTE